MLEYNEFKEYMEKRVREELDDTLDVTPKSVRKNNGVMLDGLMISDSRSNMAPTLYLNDCYERYKSGDDLESIVNSLVDGYKRNKNYPDINADAFLDYSLAKDNIAFKLIGKEKNEDLLKEIPAVPFLDLEIVFFYIASQDEEKGLGTVLITNSLMENWGITVDELYRDAMKNTPELLPFRMKELGALIEDLTGVDLEKGEEPEGVKGMHVLTNKRTYVGAGAILYPSLLKDFADKEESDIIILPSSIHETILLPVREDKIDEEIEEVNPMIRDINMSCVSKEEVLSDHAYIYRRSVGKIMIPESVTAA